jgi:hypothetical protein
MTPKKHQKTRNPKPITAKSSSHIQQHHHQQIQPKPFHHHNAMQKPPTLMVFFFFFSRIHQITPNCSHLGATQTQKKLQPKPQKEKAKRPKKNPRILYN